MSLYETMLHSWTHKQKSFKISESDFFIQSSLDTSLVVLSTRNVQQAYVKSHRTGLWLLAKINQTNISAISYASPQLCCLSPIAAGATKGPFNGSSKLEGAESKCQTELVCLKHSDSSENQSVWNTGEISLPIIVHHVHMRLSESLLSEAFSLFFHPHLIITSPGKEFPYLFCKGLESNLWEHDLTRHVSYYCQAWWRLLHGQDKCLLLETNG